MALPPPTPGLSKQPLAALRGMVGTLLLGLVIVLVVAVVYLPGELWALPPLWVPVAQVGAAVALHAACNTVGYRLPALAPGTPPQEIRTLALQRNQTAVALRFGLCESLALASLAGAFILDEGGPVVVIVGIALTAVLLMWHAWPTRRVIDRSAASLERDGVASSLHEALGLTPPHRGAIQEL